MSNFLPPVSNPLGSPTRGNGDLSAERVSGSLPATPAGAGPSTGAPPPAPSSVVRRASDGHVEESGVDLMQRRDQLRARFAELQWDLGGLAYEMAIRDHIRLEVLVRHAALLQDVDAELGEVERILHMEETGTAGSCAACAAPHSTGAVYCWQCGQPLLRHVRSDAIGGELP
jgi:hypothetical protein